MIVLHRRDHVYLELSFIFPKKKKYKLCSTVRYLKRYDAQDHTFQYVLHKLEAELHYTLLLLPSLQLGLFFTLSQFCFVNSLLFFYRSPL